MEKRKNNKKTVTDVNDIQETVEEYLSTSVLAISCNVDLLDHLNSGEADIEIKGDALTALHHAFLQAIKELRIAIYRLDNKYKLIPENRKDSGFVCKACEKTYSGIDYMMLETPWGDHPCTSCGSCEYTVTARDGLRTTEVGRQAA